MRIAAFDHGWSARGRSGRWRIPGLLAVVAAVVCPALAAPPAGLKTRLGSALSKLPHEKTVAGVSVLDLSTGQPLYDREADRPLVPASNMKVFIMAAALIELGPDFAFETRLATDGTHLYLIGDGDPGLGDEKIHKARGESIYAPFERWAQALRARGISVIPGDLVLDAGIFDDELIHPDWEPADLGKWYAAPVAGLNFNDNCLDITVAPAAKGGTTVTVQPQAPALKIINTCKSGGKGEPTLHHPPGTLEYHIRGRCNKRWTFSPVAFPDPVLLTGESLRGVLARNGVTVNGSLKRGRVRNADGSLPPQLSVVGTHRTPLADVLQRIGKDSQNMFAECLLKRLGHAWAVRAGVDDARGSWALGGEAVLAALRSAGVNVGGLVVSDGSGLSRKNICTARQLTAVLTCMDRRPGGDLFRESLAEAGVDGSLRRRLRDVNAAVHAKTGTMRGIRTLSGYVEGGKGDRYAFAVMFNGYPGSSAPYKDIQDRVCRILAGTGGP